MTDETAILIRKLNTMFPEKLARDQAAETLASYGSERHEPEPQRVRLAILKLAGGALDKLEHYTDLARHDYRDVLAWAEYPRQSGQGSLNDGPEKERLTGMDRDAYEAWLAE